MRSFRSIRNSLIVVFFLAITAFKAAHFGAFTVLHPKQLWWAINFQLPSPDATIANHPSAIWRGSERFFISSQSKHFGNWQFVSLHGFLQRHLGRHYVEDPQRPIALLTNGYITWNVTPGKALPSEISSINANLEQLYRLSDFLKSQNIPLFYINFPHKIHKTTPLLPRGISSDINEMTDKFLSCLGNADIDYLDIRDIFLKNPEEHYRLFFPGDHHWRNEYAFLAFHKIAEKLEKYDVHIPDYVLDENSYDLSDEAGKENFPLTKQSQTVRVGLYYSPVCKDEIRQHYIPKFKTDLTISIPEDRYIKRGTFKESGAIKKAGDGLRKTKIAVNHLVEGKKILFIKDSFGHPIFEMLILGVHEVVMIDMRHFSQSLIDYVQEIQPDVVIIGYHTGFFKTQMHMNFITPTPGK